MRGEGGYRCQLPVEDGEYDNRIYNSTLYAARSMGPRNREGMWYFRRGVNGVKMSQSCNYIPEVAVCQRNAGEKGRVRARGWDNGVN